MNIVNIQSTMTAQRTDTIIINNNEHKLYTLPLNQYWENFGQTLPLLGSCTSLSRGYYATWLLEDNKLYLIDFWGEFFFIQKEYSLADIFPNQEKVFASWFTGDLLIPVGKEVNYFHGGLGGWTHEYEAAIKIENGFVVATDFIDS